MISEENMILEFSVENTFSIKERQTISFEAAVDDKNTDDTHCVDCAGKKILKLACIYGANASGKTKMARALYFYIDFIISSFTDLKPNAQTNFVPFAFSEQTKKLPGKFEVIFYMNDVAQEASDKFVRYKYNISLSKDSVVEESLSYAPKGKTKLLFERSSSGDIKWGLDITGAKKNIAEMTRKNCSVISAGAQAKHPIFAKLYDYFSNRFKGLIQPSQGGLSGYIAQQLEKNKDFKMMLLTLLKASDIGNITDIKTKTEILPDELIAQFPQEMQEEIAKLGEKPKTRRLSFIHSYGKEYELPISEESAGTRRLMDLSVPLIDILSNSSLLIIDELETSLHEAIVETFIETYLISSARLGKDSQLLFTTHDQDLLDSGLLRDDEVWFCYKDDTGGSIYNSITDFTDIRKGISRKKLYQAGKFGALPNIDMQKLTEQFCAAQNR